MRVWVDGWFGQIKRTCQKSWQQAILYIFRYMSFVKSFLIISKNGMFSIEIPSRREYHFLEDLKKKCYIQVKKRRVEKQPLNSEFLDEIYVTINVFK